MYVSTYEADLIAVALRKYAKIIIESPEGSFTTEEAKALDRALRCCPAITDIDVVWVQWRYYAEKFGWLTDTEIKTTKTGRRTYIQTK